MSSRPGASTLHRGRALPALASAIGRRDEATVAGHTPPGGLRAYEPLDHLVHGVPELVDRDGDGERRRYDQ
jgi:hypothetical protein